MPSTAVVVGSGPNGLGCRHRAGAGRDKGPGPRGLGGSRRRDAFRGVDVAGFLHDLGSAVHPLAVASPFFSAQHLENHGLSWAWPLAELAHPFEGRFRGHSGAQRHGHGEPVGSGRPGLLPHLHPLAAEWDELRQTAFQPLRWPRHPFAMARIGLRGIRPATAFVRANFQGSRASTLFAGLAAHSFSRSILR